MLADGYGTVVEVGSSVKNKDILNKPVILTPMRGWESDPVGPEADAGPIVCGSAQGTEMGTAQDYVVVEEEEAVAAPPHLSPAEGAALPLVGLTGWRAFVTKSGNAEPGRNILITGVGGGVALQVLQFAVGFGCNVFVTSGDQAKIDKAKKMGAKGGVIYKNNGWEKELNAMLPDDRHRLDAIIDGAGGNVVSKACKMLKPGGVIVQYGMTVAPKMDWNMQAVLMNVDLKGSTMGSRKEFKEMVAFVNEKKIRPIVSKTVKGLSNLEAIDGLFSEMDAGRQFGKLVIEIDDVESSPKL